MALFSALGDSNLRTSASICQFSAHRVTHGKRPLRTEIDSLAQFAFYRDFFSGFKNTWALLGVYSEKNTLSNFLIMNSIS